MPSHSEFQQHNPLRTPHWRWLRAGDLVAYKKKRSPAVDDGATLAAVEFFEQWRTGSRGQQASRTEMPAMSRAYDIFREAGLSRVELEGRVLANQTVAGISEVMELEPDVVRVYEEIYFDVRPYLEASMWVLTSAIENPGWPNHETTGLAEALKQVAYSDGLLRFELLLAVAKQPASPIDLKTPTGRQQERLRLVLETLVLARDPRVSQKVAAIWSSGSVEAGIAPLESTQRGHLTALDLATVLAEGQWTCHGKQGIVAIKHQKQQVA